MLCLVDYVRSCERSFKSALMALGMDHPINWLNDPRTALFSIVLVTLWCDLGYNFGHIDVRVR